MSTQATAVPGRLLDSAEQEPARRLDGAAGGNTPWTPRTAQAIARSEPDPYWGSDAGYSPTVTW